MKGLTFRFEASSFSASRFSNISGLSSNHSHFIGYDRLSAADDSSENHSTANRREDSTSAEDDNVLIDFVERNKIMLPV